MIRLLILCRFFSPENKIGAIRPSKLVKYLTETGKYKITVIAAMPYGVDCPEYEITQEGIEIFRVNTGKIASLLHYKKAGKGAAVASEISNSSKKISLKYIITSILFRLRLSMEKNAMLRNAKNILRKNKKEFDIIFSTYNTEFGHMVAEWYKKRHRDISWIADFRDSVWLANSTPEQIKKAKRFARRVANRCDLITAVSQGILETHKEDFKCREARVVYNGFDSADIPKASPLNDGIMRMAYTGELYSGQRDLTPIFKALYKLSDEGRVDLSKIQIVYAGNSGGVFEQQIKPFGAINYLNKGFIPRAEALKLQLESNILLLSSWCHKGDKHTLTGKFFEYLGMKRPILSVISGEETGCILKEMINAQSLGFCYEEANAASDTEELCSFLEKQYRMFNELGKTEFSPNEEFVESFEYKNIAKQMDNIICEMLNI